MITSQIREMCAVEFPTPQNLQIYMHAIDLESPEIPNTWGAMGVLVRKLIALIKPSKGKAFVTIDEKVVEVGNTHRRGGPHVDGNYLFEWGGGWLTGTGGRFLPAEQHIQQYAADGGGMIIASSYPACRAWTGEFFAVPKQGGDCSHIQKYLDSADSLLLNANTAYLTNSTCIHESLPLPETTYRQLVRITFPHTIDIKTI